MSSLNRTRHSTVAHLSTTTTTTSSLSENEPLTPTVVPPVVSTKVCVRLRPLIHVPELQDGRLCISEDGSQKKLIRITSPDDSENVQEFMYDAIFGPESTQAEVFELTAKRLVRGVLEDGVDGTVVAYGQTGTGKTHTIQGPEDDPGLITQCARHIFEHVERAPPQRKFLICCSMLLIYENKIHDLLSKSPMRRLRLRENTQTNQFYVPNLTTFMVVKTEQIEKILRKAISNAAKVNPEALRWRAFHQDSFRMFRFSVEQCDSDDSFDGDVSVESIRTAELLFVDLAGSEGRKRRRLVHSRDVLNLVIEMLRQRHGRPSSQTEEGEWSGRETSHNRLPYRDSALTRLLWNSLGHNSKAVLIATVSPSSYSYPETLFTLRQALRARSVTTASAILIPGQGERRENPRDTLIPRFLQQIHFLENQLEEERDEEEQSTIRSKLTRLRKALLVGGSSSTWGVWEDSLRVAEGERVGFLLDRIAKEGLLIRLVECVGLEGRILVIGFPWMV